MNQATGFNLSPGYISGLAQTDGSFFCSVVISTKHRFGLQFRPKFTLTADLDSKYVLDSIAQYFSCGKVNTNLKTHSAEYLVERIEDLQNIIIPHFTLGQIILYFVQNCTLLICLVLYSLL